MAIVISFNKMVIEGITKSDFYSELNDLESICALVDSEEEGILESVEGLAGLVGDFKYVDDAEVASIEEESDKIMDLRAKVRALEKSSAANAICPHGFPIAGTDCTFCHGDGTEELKLCPTCNSGSFHRSGLCTVCTPNKPYEALLSRILDYLSASNIPGEDKEYPEIQELILKALRHIQQAN